MIKNLIRKKLFFFILAITVTSCTSTDIYTGNSEKIKIKTPKISINKKVEEIEIEDNFPIDNQMDALKKEQERILLSGSLEEIDRVILENELLKSFEYWKGTKYRWGGDSHKGIDCSALTRRVYREVFNYELPRVAIAQANHGRKIKTSELEPGDILFFRPENRVNHTAVYLGNNLFINASSSKGVIISSLESKYWGKYFKYAVRIDGKRA